MRFALAKERALQQAAMKGPWVGDTFMMKVGGSAAYGALLGAGTALLVEQAFFPESVSAGDKRKCR